MYAQCRSTGLVSSRSPAIEIYFTTALKLNSCICTQTYRCARAGTVWERDYEIQSISVQLVCMGNKAAGKELWASPHTLGPEPIRRDGVSLELVNMPLCLKLVSYKFYL